MQRKNSYVGPGLTAMRDFLPRNTSYQQQKEPAVAKLSARNKRVKRSVKIGDVVPEVSAQMEALDGRIEAIQLW
jgi:hypothetical protein